MWNVWTDVKLPSFFSRWFPWNIKLQCRGVQSTVETAPNEAIHLCWKQSLINSVYLLFQSSFATFGTLGMARGKAENRSTDILFPARLPQSVFSIVYFLIWICIWALQSNSLNWAWMNLGNLWEGLYSIFELSIWFLRWIHLRGLFRSPFSLVLHEWDSVPDGSLCWSLPT